MNGAARGKHAWRERLRKVRRKVYGDFPPRIVDLVRGALAMYGRRSHEELAGASYFTLSREDATTRTSGVQFTIAPVDIRIPTKR